MGGIIGSYGQSDLMRGNSGRQQEAGDLYQRSRGQNGMKGSFDVRGGSSESSQNNGNSSDLATSSYLDYLYLS